MLLSTYKHLLSHSASHGSQYILFIVITKTYQTDSYQYDDGYRASEAPDEFVIDRDPTEVWVPVTLWVQAHCQACSKRQIRSDVKIRLSSSSPEREQETGDKSVAVKVRRNRPANSL